MSLTDAINAKYKVAASAITKAGGTPLPTNETLLKLLTYYINEDELDFVAAFENQTSQTMAQLKENTGLSEAEIEKKVEDLAARGVIFNQPNRHGLMVYRLLPMLNVGIFEYTFMNKLEDTPRNREIAALFFELKEWFKDLISKNYDQIIPQMSKMPPIDRTVPMTENKATGAPIKIEINQRMDLPDERILPTQDVAKIINKFDEIAVGHCFCRHYRDMLGRSCRQTDEREACFTFGKSARYTSSQGFARMITKKEALEILQRSADAGLVHKAYHPNFDINKEETSICNCCRCCCGNSVENSQGMVRNATNYLAVIDPDLCIGCGTCVDKCHTHAAYLNDQEKAERVEERCIGCGVCAAFCPENAISLKEGERIVHILLAKKA